MLEKKKVCQHFLYAWAHFLSSSLVSPFRINVINDLYELKCENSDIPLLSSESTHVMLRFSPIVVDYKVAVPPTLGDLMHVLLFLFSCIRSTLLFVFYCHSQFIIVTTKVTATQQQLEFNVVAKAISNRSP